jgi:hypothetical protein
MKMLGYTKKWFRDDRNFQWRPICSSSAACLRAQENRGDSLKQTFSRRGVIRSWWLFALQGVLRAIDPVHPWQILMWLEVRRKAHLRKQYIDLFLLRLQCAREESWQRQHRSITKRATCIEHETWDEEKERSLEEIQVAIPLADLLSYRQTARQLDAAHVRELQEHHSSRKLCLDRASPDVIVDILPCPQEMHDAQNSTVEFRKHDSWPKSLLLGVSQVHFHLEQVTAVVLDSPDICSVHDNSVPEEFSWKTALKTWLRRPLVELRLGHSKAMLSMNPAYQADVSHVDEDFDTAHLFSTEFQASIDNLQALYCCAPTSCPVLRHIIRRASGHLLEGYLHEGSEPLVQLSVRRTFNETLRTVQSVIKLEIPPVSLALYGPLLEQLSGEFSNHHQQEACSHKADESFRHSILTAGKNLREKHSKDLLWKKQRRLFEFLTKSDEQGSKLSTQTNMQVGELEVLVVQPFSQQRYLEQRVLLPAIVQKFTQTSDESMPNVSVVTHIGVDQPRSPPQTPTDITGSSMMSRMLSIASTSSLVSDCKASAIEREDGLILLQNSQAHLPMMNPLPLPGINLPKPSGGQGSDVASLIAGFRTSAFTFMGCRPPCPCSNRNELGVQWTPHSSPRTDDMVGMVSGVVQDWDHLPIPMRQLSEDLVESGRVCLSMAVVDAESLGTMGLQNVCGKDIHKESFVPVGQKVSEIGSKVTSPACQGKAHGRHPGCGKMGKIN